MLQVADLLPGTWRPGIQQRAQRSLPTKLDDRFSNNTTAVWQDDFEELNLEEIGTPRLFVLGSLGFPRKGLLCVWSGCRVNTSCEPGMKEYVLAQKMAVLEKEWGPTRKGSSCRIPNSGLEDKLSASQPLCGQACLPCQKAKKLQSRAGSSISPQDWLWFKCC